MVAQPHPAPACPGTGVTLAVSEFADAIGLASNLETAGRLLAVAVEQVTRYAPRAPAAMANEAAIRFGGYLAQSDFGGIRQEGIGEKSVEYVTNHAAAFRNSGAAALLTRYKVRRAGSIG